MYNYTTTTATTTTTKKNCLLEATFGYVAEFIFHLGPVLVYVCILRLKKTLNRECP